MELSLTANFDSLFITESSELRLMSTYFITDSAWLRELASLFRTGKGSVVSDALRVLT